MEKKSDWKNWLKEMAGSQRDLIVVIIVLLCLAGVLYLLFFEPAERLEAIKNTCEFEGFEYAKFNKGIEPGYINCCKKRYVNHSRDDECKIIKISQKVLNKRYEK